MQILKYAFCYWLNILDDIPGLKIVISSSVIFFLFFSTDHYYYSQR